MFDEFGNWYGFPGDHPPMGCRDIASFCEDCSSMKAGPTFIAHRVLDPDVPSFHRLIESLTMTYADELWREFWPERAA